jgi:hypothetical protein
MARTVTMAEDALRPVRPNAFKLEGRLSIGDDGALWVQDACGGQYHLVDLLAEVVGCEVTVIVTPRRGA